MTTAVQESNAKEKRDELASWLLAFAKLPAKKRTRVRKLVSLCLQAETNEEQHEIANAIAEIVVQAKMGITRTVTVDLEEGISPSDKETVDAYYRQLGQTIREYREKGHMTQKQLARASGLPQSHISRLEAGIHSPTRKTIERLAAALNVPPSKLDLLYHD